MIEYYLAQIVYVALSNHRCFKRNDLEGQLKIIGMLDEISMYYDLHFWNYKRYIIFKEINDTNSTNNSTLY